jgi:hypothetical protein
MTPRLSALLLLAAASCAAPPAVLRSPTGEYLPLDPGLEWTYEADGQVQTRRVSGVESVGRFECRIVESRTGDYVERSWMRWDRDGLKVYRVSNSERTVDFDDPILLVHRLAAPGATWKFEERYGPVTLAVDAKYEGEEEVSAANRVFPCSRIRLVKRVAGRVVVDQTSWYAKDVGLVRMTLVEAGEEKETRTTLVLKSCSFLPQ